MELESTWQLLWLAIRIFSQLWIGHFSPLVQMGLENASLTLCGLNFLALYVRTYMILYFLILKVHLLVKIPDYWKASGCG